MAWVNNKHKSQTSFANLQIYLQRSLRAKELEYSEKIKQEYSIEIGNNVWIGNNVVITSEKLEMEQ